MKMFSRSYGNRWFLSGLVVFSLLLIAVLVYGTVFLPSKTLQLALMKGIPWSLRLNFFLIAMAVVFCRGDISVVLRNLFLREKNSEKFQSKRRWRLALRTEGVILIFILLMALLLIFQAPVRTHRIYYDEDIYADVGQNIAYVNQAGSCDFGTFEYGEYKARWLDYNKDPCGWPFLISLVFQVFGVDEEYAFTLNNLIYIGNILVVFFMVRVISLDRFAAASAALVMALIPAHLIWSNTAAAEPSALFFVGLSLLCFFIYLRTGLLRHLFLTAAVVPFACQFRPESGFILPLLGCTALLHVACGNFFFKEDGSGVSVRSASHDDGRWLPNLDFFKRIATRQGWMAGLVLLFLLCPYLLHLHAVGGQSWGATGPKFSADFFLQNLHVNGLYYLNNQSFPLLFTLLAFVGLFSGERRTFGARLVLETWFLFFWGIFLFFYAGSYDYGADERFALLSFMPLAALAGLGAGTMKKILKGRGAAFGLIFLLVFSWVQFLPLIRTEGEEAWSSRYDHRYARAFIEKIPRRSIVLTQTPDMFLLWGQSAIQSYAAITNPEVIQDLMRRYPGQVYFHQSYWCNSMEDPQWDICQGVRERYRLEKIAVAHEQAYTYGLYRLSRKEKIIPAGGSGCR
ncbi:Dolichyl-phosphate-mannose-protein mannosyltransferase [Syntrophus gentianae]|uniref:Dolichyl-phosphate-mannose-protein mannosyltransferase n=2 Tax=Syntrophus gentianae TaxID=43775 RepID=A0A1H7Z4B0_9BACT|nr:Dolichyl-phosphate-mannose-protein mannosyltransferase [Syntrophus gentianae]